MELVIAGLMPFPCILHGKPGIMHPSFQQTFEQIEQQRANLIKRLQTLPTEVYHRSPAQGQWSISQVMTHLITAERLSLMYMKKKAQGIDQLPDAGLLASLRIMVLKVSQRFPLKFKAPKVVVENTPPAWSFEEMVTQWDTLRQELATFLNNIEERHVHRQVYKHPLAGRLDARQAMIFFQEHIIHHQPQINRLIPSAVK